ncbi:hypothetical protein J7643_17145 [bacterium]|nr:hypothetical protein [bacterium]
MKQTNLALVLGVTLLAGCVAPSLTGRPTGTGTLEVLPRVSGGQLRTQAIVPGYMQADVDHLVVKLYTLDGNNEAPVLDGSGNPVQKDVASSSLNVPIRFGYLHPYTTYRVRAFAYKAAGTAQQDLISDDAGSYAEIQVAGNNERPSLGTLPVKLLDRLFSGQASAGITVTNGTYQAPTSAASVQAGYEVSNFVGDGTGIAANNPGSPISIVSDAQGNVYWVDIMSNTVRKATPQGVVTTLAGSSAMGWNDGTLANSSFTNLFSIAIDKHGDLFVSQLTPYGGLRKISIANNTVETITDQNNQRFTDVYYPYGMAFDSQGNLFVSEYNRHVIKKITLNGTTATSISVFAGAENSAGTSDSTGNDGTTARFLGPTGLACDSNDTLYVADGGNHAIRKISPSGKVTTLAGLPGAANAGGVDGTGSEARFRFPWGLALDPQGNLFVAENANHAIRRITPGGVVRTFAGKMGHPDRVNGPAATARLQTPFGVTYAPGGILYVSEFSSIRKID